MPELFNEAGDFNTTRAEIDSWTLAPVSKELADPMEMVWLNSGYAIEQFQWDCYYHALDMTPDRNLQKMFARISFQEEEHLSKIGSVADPNMTPMESALALQMTAIQEFSEAAQLEPNEVCKDTYDYILLDHLTQMKMLSDSAARTGIAENITNMILSSFGMADFEAGAAIKTKARPEELTKGTLQIMEGRPIEKQFIPMNAIFKQPLNKDTADVMSFVNIQTLLANEMQLRNEYQMFRKMMPSDNVRSLLNIATAVENIHITMLESLIDPSTTHLEYAMVGELAEIKTHRQGLQFSGSDSARAAHEYALGEDVKHLDWLRAAYSNFGSPAKYKETDKLFVQPEVPAREYISHVAEAMA